MKYQFLLAFASDIAKQLFLMQESDVSRNIATHTFVRLNSLWLLQYQAWIHWTLCLLLPVTVNVSLILEIRTLSLNFMCSDQQVK